MKMTNENVKTWRINRQINLSVFVQLIFLASLIIASWVNLQRQLDLLQHDVAILIQDNKQSPYYLIVKNFYIQYLI